MSEKVINIETNAKVLVGEGTGKKLYDTYFRPNIDGNKVMINFPRNVEDISISVVMGIKEGLLEDKIFEEFYNKFEINGNKNVVEKFYKSLKY